MVLCCGTVVMLCRCCIAFQRIGVEVLRFSAVLGYRAVSSFMLFARDIVLLLCSTAASSKLLLIHPFLSMSCLTARHHVKHAVTDTTQVTTHATGQSVTDISR